MADKEVKRWVTINGRRIPIRKKNYTPLYHGTTWKNALDILESNELRANVSNETETYGVSTTRNKDTAYDNVRIALDKDKLRERYKVEPTYRESIFGRDLAEERIDRTITDVDKYIRQIQWNDDSKSNMQMRILRRRLVEHFNDVNYTSTPSNDAYYIKRIAQIAKAKGISLDKRMQEAVSWIQRFDDRQFDEERYQQMLELRKRKGN